MEITIVNIDKKHSSVISGTVVIILENLDKDETDENHENTENKG